MELIFTNRPIHLVYLGLLLSTTLGNHPSSSAAVSDYTSLVYKGCAKQTVPDSSNTLSSLFDSLISQSSTTKFFKTTSTLDQTSISALFQCRGDLTNGDCYDCVSQLPQMLNSLCGKTTSARLQLLGCYLLYEPENSPQISGLQMLHKTCSDSHAVGDGFEERRDTAFAALEKGISSGYGYYTTIYEGLEVWGQCEGDSGIGDCVECVKSAIEKAQSECGGSTSGQVYLQKCSVSYGHYPKGVPRTYYPGERKGHSISGRTLAIVLIGAAGVVFFGFLFLAFIKSYRKKDDY